jgi:hypothetical protein
MLGRQSESPEHTIMNTFLAVGSPVPVKFM